MYFYVYIQSDNLFTVGYQVMNGGWHPDSDHETRDEAARRVHYLNGGTDHPYTWLPIKHKSRDVSPDELSGLF